MTTWNDIGAEDFVFYIRSPKHGLFRVVAPERFRDQVMAHRWCIVVDKNRSAGRQAWAGTNTKGKKRTFISLHRFIWSLAGNAPAQTLDHIDGQPLNNSLSNLRAATYGQNTANRVKPRSNTSGHVGVYWHKRDRIWCASIGAGRKLIHLGRFSSMEEAIAARREAEPRLHGQFAALTRKDYSEEKR